MVELNSIFADMEKEKVSLIPYEVGEEKSVTLEINNQYAIFIDTFRVKTITETKWILAHELGHCATGCTHKVSSSLDLVEKHEYKANRWAIEKYIPFEELSVAIQDGYTEKWQLAEYFDMPESFIDKTLNYYFVTKQRKLA